MSSKIKVAFIVFNLCFSLHAQQDLAKELGVAFSTVSRWFNGKTIPSKIQQYHVEKYLNKREKEIAKTIKRGKS